jgi:hypothetical protein
MKAHIRRRHNGVGQPLRNSGQALDDHSRNMPFAWYHRDMMLRAGGSIMDDRSHDFIENSVKRLKTFREYNDLMRELFMVAPIYRPSIIRYHHQHYNYCRNCGLHSPSPSIRDPYSGFKENANVADDVNNFVTYESREIGISLNYPSSWFVHKLRNNINYHHVTFLLPPKMIGSMQYYGKLDLLGGSHLQGASIT